MSEDLDSIDWENIRGFGQYWLGKYQRIWTVLIGKISEDLDSIDSETLTLYSNITNKLILTETIEFIRKSERFNNLEAFTTWFV